MLQAKEDQVVDILSNGLMNFANASDDRSMLQAGAMALREVRDVFVENIKANDTCAFTFPSMVVLPDIRTDCFVAVLNKRVIVAWRWCKQDKRLGWMRLDYYFVNNLYIDGRANTDSSSSTLSANNASRFARACRTRRCECNIRVPQRERGTDWGLSAAKARGNS